MSDYSLDLNEDQQTLVDWVHTFAADVIRPAAEEWELLPSSPAFGIALVGVGPSLLSSL